WSRMLRALEATAVLPPLASSIAPTSEGRRAAPELLRKSWRRPVQRVKAAQAGETTWHEVRKAAKSNRYAAERLEPRVGPKAHRLAREAERMQTQLGEQCDLIMASVWLERHRVNAPDATAAARQSLAFGANGDNEAAA